MPSSYRKINENRYNWRSGSREKYIYRKYGNATYSKGHKLAVLAIDPSSGRSGGSILGDKTRMEELSGNPNAFIRPSASGGSLGGVANKTRETMLLCEAAGFDIIFIETVGVGQSEVAVHSMVDFFLLLMLAGAGDELQGIKRGIMEMADAVVINKADGSNKDKALRAKAEYNSALHLFPMPESNYAVKVQTCSAFHNLGLDEIWQNIEGYFKQTSKSGFLNFRRRQQAKNWMHQIIKSSLIDSFYKNETLMDNLSELEQKVLAGEKNPYYAASVLLNRFFKKEIFKYQGILNGKIISNFGKRLMRVCSSVV